jgi:hypothetical protein
VNLKFNFYDIYGFALPGFLLLTILWFPFGLVEKIWPDLELSSALVGVILAYIAGHILQTVAEVAIPSKVVRGSFPSDKFLDEDDSTFTTDFKNRLTKQIFDEFALNIHSEAGDRDKVRNDAFFLCRSALIKSKTVIYAEQFQGLYALMRGFTTAFAIGVVYYLGWVYAALVTWQWSGVVLLAGLVVATGAGLTNAKRTMIASLLISAFAAGHYLGLSRIAVSQHRNHLLVAAVFSFFGSERCYSTYKKYAGHFAIAVYRDFSVYQKSNAEAQRAGNEGQGKEDADEEENEVD